MKHTQMIILLLGLILALSLGSALGQEEGDQVAVSGTIAAGVQAVGETARSSKFTEYRDVPRGLFVESIDLRLTKGSRYFNLSAMNVQQADERILAGFGDSGRFRLDIGFDKIPHRFSFFGATPYVENAPGVFTLNDVIRQAAEDLVPTGTDTNIALARSLVSSFLTNAAPIYLGLQRKKASLDFSYTPAVAWSFNASGTYEERSGNRPYGAPLGFSNDIELPEPIRHRTTNVDTNIEYHKKWGSIRAGLAASIFKNDVAAMIWDNPYRITDSTWASAYSAGNGTARGQMALWPSNDALRFYLSGTYKPVRSTRISATASYSLFSQNEALQPFTINTAIPASSPNAAGALSPPRETAMAKANITSLDLTLNSRLTRSVTLTAGFRYYDFADKIEELDIPEGYARLDQVWEDIPVAIEPYSYTRTRLFADLSVRVFDSTTLTAGYTIYGMRRHEGSHETEKNKTDEGVFKATVNSTPLDWLSLRLSYLNSDRDWTLEDTWYAYIPSFNFKRFHENSRKRQAVNALVSLTPVDKLDLQLSYSIGRDDYPHSDYGLKRDDFDMYGVDISYAFAPNQVLYAFYASELYDADQASRQSGATFSENPANDWTANLKDKVDTFGAGQTIELVSKTLRFDLSGSYSKANGTSSLYSPPGGTPGNANNFTKPLDTTTWFTIRSSFNWQMMKNLAVILGYFYEQYDFEDITRNDVAVDYATAGAIYLGAIEPGYKYHVGFLKFVFSF